MRTIEINQFDEFAKHYAIFFTPEGILTDNINASILMPFSHTVNLLGIHIDAIYLDNKTLIVQCQSLSLLNQFSISSERAALIQTLPPIQEQLLRAIHWVTWNRKYQYCTQCGTRLNKILTLVEKKCPACHTSFFPSLSPAIMVLIQRNDEILLGRSPHFRPGIYSALAGFIDIGESAESAVHREVKEEVGIEISDLRYFSTQSWPFSQSFMIAFKAQYLKGDLIIDKNEIEDAQWFNINHLPALPPFPSIARQLIDSVLSH